jgi:hypothetical protein
MPAIGDGPGHENLYNALTALRGIWRAVAQAVNLRNINRM